MIELSVAFIVLAEKFLCDDFGFRPSQFHIFLLLTDSHGAAHDIDADKCLTLLRKVPVDEEGGRRADEAIVGPARALGPWITAVPRTLFPVALLNQPSIGVFASATMERLLPLRPPEATIRLLGASQDYERTERSARQSEPHRARHMTCPTPSQFQVNLTQRRIIG